MRLLVAAILLVHSLTTVLAGVCQLFPFPPCHNGGSCVDVDDTYECLCPPGFGGTRCETAVTATTTPTMTTHSDFRRVSPTSPVSATSSMDSTNPVAVGNTLPSTQTELPTTTATSQSLPVISSAKATLAPISDTSATTPPDLTTEMPSTMTARFETSTLSTTKVLVLASTDGHSSGAPLAASTTSAPMSSGSGFVATSSAGPQSSPVFVTSGTTSLPTSAAVFQTSPSAASASVSNLAVFTSSSTSQPLSTAMQTSPPPPSTAATTMLTTPMTSPMKNTTFKTLPPSTTKAGQPVQCYRCRDIKVPGLCPTTVTCDASKGEDSCYVEELLNDRMEVHYQLGCATSADCEAATTGQKGAQERAGLAARQGLTITSCFRCCQGPLCNNQYCKDLCESNDCVNGGSCSIVNGEPHCSCPPGYTGERCEIDQDECSSSPCQNGGTCHDSLNGFFCSCPLRYSGPTCSTAVKGAICYQCQGVDSPLNCLNMTVCPENYECFADEVVLHAKVTFNLGCRTRAFCEFFGAFGRRSVEGVEEAVEAAEAGREVRGLERRQGHAVTRCSHCCTGDLCNGQQCLDQRYASCEEYLDRGYVTSGTYYLRLHDNGPDIKVYCDMGHDGGGWIVLQRRKDGSQNFFRFWNDYKRGFGDLEGEFWLGLESIHRLTNHGAKKLLVRLRDWEGQTRTAAYSKFSVSDEKDFYRLHVSGYSGDAGDSLSPQDGMAWTTEDADHDTLAGDNCAGRGVGAWWFSQCGESNLNGLFHSNAQAQNTQTGITWLRWRGASYSLRYVEMWMK